MQYFVNSQVNSENGLKRDALLPHFFNPVLWELINKRTEHVEAIMKLYQWRFSVLR
ncbi:MAG: hypothetical protein LBC47_04410 [Tannerella sp.]|nr:hypothetical protein [Tannerella sp.]